MTYNELERQIQNINIDYDKQLIVSHNERYVTIRDDDWSYAIVSNRVPYALHTPCLAFEHLETIPRYDLLKVVYEFAQTPIEKRKSEQMYYISSKLTPQANKKFLFKFGGSVDHLAWGVKDGGGTEFTQEEIDEIKEKYDTDLKDFEIIEVEE